MFKKTLISLAVASSLGLTGCFDSAGSGSSNANPDYKISQDDNTAEFLAQFEGKVWPVFDPFPSVSDLPIPNDLIYSSVGDGSFTVPDKRPPVTTALNWLSGASTVAPIDLKMSGSIDGETVFGPDAAALGRIQTALQGGVAPSPTDVGLVLRQNVFLIELEYASGAPLQALEAKERPTAKPIFDFEIEVLPLNVTDDNGNVEVKDFIRILPTKPLNPNKRYVVAILDEVQAEDGQQIVSSPAYTMLDTGDDVDEEQVEPPALGSVSTLIDNLWEPIAERVVNGLRGQFSTETEITQRNFALTYSFTTSGDEKVLAYNANPNLWLGDQVVAAAKLGITKKVTGAALYFAYKNDPENNDILAPSTWDLNDDGVVNDADFVRQEGRDQVIPADFILADRNGDGEVNQADWQIALAPDSEDGFGYVDLKKSVDETPISAALDNPALATCDEAPYEVPTTGGTDVGSQSLCVGTLFSGSLASAGIELPQAESAGNAGVSLDFDNAQRVEELSAVLGNFVGDGNPAGVTVAQGSIQLPYYMGIPSGDSTAADAATLRNSFWKADSGLAQNLNVFLEGAGFDLELPQGTGESEVVNSVFPFPKETGDVRVPMLAIYPAGADLETGNLPVVIYQHGITTDRSTALTFGSALVAGIKDAGGPDVAVIAIDQPLHGISPARVAANEDPRDPVRSLTGWAGVLLDGVESNPALGLNEGDLVNPTIIGALVQSALSGDTATFEAAVEAAVSPTQAAMINSQADILASTVAKAGSTVAGLTSVNTGQGLNTGGVTERHFGYATDECNTVEAMNFPIAQSKQESGDLFINPSNFMGSRDILRQGALDLMTLRASIADMAPGFDENNVYFVGHSLGTVNGGSFVAATNQSGRPGDLGIKGANLLTPVGGIIRMIENSPALAPAVLGGLQLQANLTQEDSGLQTFLNVFQAALDSTDPINFAEDLQNVLISQVDGDQTVINDGIDTLDVMRDYTTCGVTIALDLNGSPSPLSGTTPLAFEIGSNTLDRTTTPADLPAFVRFFESASHSTPVLPADELEQAAFAQMVSQTVSIILSNGINASVTPDADGTEASVVNQ